MRRYGQVIGFNQEFKEEYVSAHAACWPEVLEKITECGIRNYTIFNKGDFLFAYFEYHGDDFEAAMKKMGEDPITQEWWKVVGKAQVPLEDRAEGEWWASMEEVFHCD